MSTSNNVFVTYYPSTDAPKREKQSSPLSLEGYQGNKTVNI